jgi:hypothetical protein
MRFCDLEEYEFHLLRKDVSVPKLVHSSSPISEANNYFRNLRIITGLLVTVVLNGHGGRELFVLLLTARKFLMHTAIYTDMRIIGTSQCCGFIFDLCI